MVSTRGKPENVVGRLLAEVSPKLKVKGMLMDKGFYNANVSKTMDDKDVDYLVPVKKTHCNNLADNPTSYCH